MEAMFVLADEALERLGETLCGVEAPLSRSRGPTGVITPVFGRHVAAPLAMCVYLHEGACATALGGRDLLKALLEERTIKNCVRERSRRDAAVFCYEAHRSHGR